MPPTDRSGTFNRHDDNAPWLAVESVTRVDKPRIQKAQPKRATVDQASSALRIAVHAYLELGLPITLCAEGTKTPISKNWHTKTWTHEAVDAEFEARGPLNPGLTVGPKSGLIDIEIDGPGGGVALLKLFHDDVPVTPMWDSARGAHRLFRWHPDLEQIGKASVAFDGLEIRLGAGGKAAQSLLPPSVTDGWERQWVISLEECDPAPLPDAVTEQLLAMFGQKSCAMPVEEDVEHSIAVFHNAVSHAVSHPHGMGGGVRLSTGKKAKRPPRPCNPILPGYRKSVQAAIWAAIGSTLPGSEGHRNRLLLQLARQLKGVPELAGLEPSELRPVIDEWHRQALPAIGTKDFAVTWHDFRVAWGNVKFPAGTGPLEEIYAVALRQMPAIASGYRTAGVRHLIALCRELQVVAGDDPFWLSCRAAAGVLKTPPTNAHRWLWRLIHDQVIDLVTPGSRGRAAEYRYLGV